MPDRRIAVGMFALFLVLALGVWLSGRSDSTTTAVEATAVPTLLDLDAADITGIEVQTSDGELRLERVDDAWWIVSPLENAADSDTLDSVLSPLTSLAVSRNLGSDLQLTDFGLDTVSTTVALTSSDGTTVVIEVGGTNPDETKHYLRLAGSDDVLLVSAYYLDRLVGMVADPPIQPTPTPEVAITATTDS